MKKRKFKHAKPNPRRADKLLPEIGKPWTQITREVHREIYFFGIRGCYKSNASLATDIGCSTRSIQRARQLLTKHQAIITARTMPRTWSAWCTCHPALKKRPVLFFKGGQIDNPLYAPPSPKSHRG